MKSVSISISQLDLLLSQNSKKPWNQAIDTAFSTAPDLSGEIQEIRRRYESDAILKPIGHHAYASNTLHTALHCVTHADSFESALKSAHKLDENYCPALVGILAGARWSVPQSMLVNSQQDTLDQIHQVAQCFNDKWDRMNGTKPGFLKRLFT